MDSPQEKKTSYKKILDKLSHYFNKKELKPVKSLPFQFKVTAIQQFFTLKQLQEVSEQEIRLLESEDEIFDKRSTPYQLITSFSREVIYQGKGFAQTLSDLGIKSGQRLLMEIDTETNSLNFDDIYKVQTLFCGLENEVEAEKAALKERIRLNEILLDKLTKEYFHLTTLLNPNQKNVLQTQKLENNEESESTSASSNGQIQPKRKLNGVHTS